ncbi:MAG: hypothetical protein HY327_09930 [Chloroflexi bacterium]|nr:hypothetical protein [Chloroflexota bacterium]
MDNLDRVSAGSDLLVDAGQPWDDITTVLKHAQEAQADRDTARAYTFYVRATELDANNAEAWAGRGATTPELDDEVVSWGYALALAPESIQAKIRLEQAVSDKIEDSQSSDAAKLFTLARDLGEAGQKEHAYRLAVRATDLDDTREEYWIWRAGLTSDLKEMISALNQALALNPQNAQAQAGLEWAFAQQAQTAPLVTPSAADEAMQFIAEGNAQLKQGDKEMAHEMFKRATELDQRNQDAWFGRGISVEATDIDEALTCMEQTLAINPGNDPAKEKRSWLRVRKLREHTAAPLAPAPPPMRVPARAQPSPAISRARLYLLVVAVLALILLFVALFRPL